MRFILFLSEAMVPLMIFYIVGFGLLSGRPVLDDFIDGAKDGMRTVAGILPTLVGLMVSVGVLRASGFLDFLGEMLKAPAASDRAGGTGPAGFQLSGHRSGTGHF